MVRYQKINNTKLNSPFFIDYTIQPLKYYYYKVSFIDDYFNESDLFPSDGYKACTVIPFHTGWPIVPTNYLGTTANGSPNIIDINSDGKKEIFFSTGSSTGAEGDKKGGLWAFNHDGTELFLSQNAINGFVDLQCDNQSTLAIDDINGDTKFEVAITTGNNPDNINIQKLFVYSSTEDIDNNYLPDELYNADISYLNVRGPVISDINNDGFKEIITNSAWDGINIYKNDGSLYKSINGFKSGYGMPVTFDFDSDGKKEIVTGCSNSPQYNSGILIFKEDGTPYNTNSPVVYSPPTSGFRTDFSPIICDIDNDNTYEILFISAKNKDAYLYAIKPDGTMVTGWEDNNVNHLSHIIELSNSVQTSDDIYNGQSGPNFSVGDINRDGKIEIVIGSKMKLYIFNGDGTLNNMINIPTYYSSAQKAPLIADIDSDHSDLEIIITDDINNNNNNKLSHIYAFKINGDIVKGFPITLDYNIKISNTPCIADVDNDDKNELFVSSALKFYLWDTEGSSYLNDWGSYRHDANNSGVLFNRECLVSNTVIEINSNNEQWLDYKQINSTLIINSGAKLTIKGYVDINPVSKIIVKPGAQLILDGCVLNSACPGQLWKGIEVMGDYTKSQLPISKSGICSFT